MHEGTNISPQVTMTVCLQLIHGAALEINTGLQISRQGNIIKAARIQGLIPKTGRYTKKQVLELSIAEMKKYDPTYEPKGSILRAMAK